MFWVYFKSGSEWIESNFLWLPCVWTFLSSCGWLAACKRVWPSVSKLFKSSHCMIAIFHQANLYKGVFRGWNLIFWDQNGTFSPVSSVLGNYGEREIFLGLSKACLGIMHHGPGWLGNELKIVFNILGNKQTSAIARKAETFHTRKNHHQSSRTRASDLIMVVV